MVHITSFVMISRGRGKGKTEGKGSLLAPLPLLQQNEFKSLFKSTLLHACVTELWLSERVGGGGGGGIV